MVAISLEAYFSIDNIANQKIFEKCQFAIKDVNDKQFEFIKKST